MLERFKARGLVKARGKQRTDSTHVLAAVHDLHLLELVAETLRATLDDLAAVVPDWLRGVARPAWFERYARRVEDYRLPKSREAARGARPRDRRGRVPPARRPGCAGCAGGGPRGADGADAARRLAGALRRGDDGRLRWRAGRGAAAGRRADAVALRSGGALQHEAAARVVGLQGARHRDLRRRRGAPDHARDDLPRDAAGHGEHGRDPRAPGRQGPAPGRALRGLGLCRRGAAGRQPARPRRLARGAGAGRGERQARGGARLRAAPLHDRLGARAGHLPAGQDVGDLARRPRRGRQPAHPRRVQPSRLRRLCRQGPLHPGEGRAPAPSTSTRARSTRR